MKAWQGSLKSKKVMEKMSFFMSEAETKNYSGTGKNKLTLFTCCLGLEEAAEKLYRVLTQRLTREETLKHF